jgi:hypothetical protein
MRPLPLLCSLGLLLLAMIGLGGCAATHAAESSPAASKMHRQDIAEGLATGYLDDDRVARIDDITVAQAALAADPRTPPNADRKLITNGELQLAVADLEQSIDQAQRWANEVGGYAQSLTNDTIHLRIPASRWDEALTRATAMGRVLQKQVQVQDVTEEFLDLEIQLANARALRQRLEELMAKAEDVKAALEVELELARVRTEIERIEGRLKYLSHNVAMSSLVLRFVAVDTAPRRTRSLPFSWLPALGVERLLGLGGRR